MTKFFEDAYSEAVFIDLSRRKMASAFRQSSNRASHSASSLSMLTTVVFSPLTCSNIPAKICRIVVFLSAAEMWRRRGTVSSDTRTRMSGFFSSGFFTGTVFASGPAPAAVMAAERISSGQKENTSLEMLFIF